jgi:hypothetical protein
VRDELVFRSEIKHQLLEVREKGESCGLQSGVVRLDIHVDGGDEWMDEWTEKERAQKIVAVLVRCGDRKVTKPEWLGEVEDAFVDGEEDKGNGDTGPRCTNFTEGVVDVVVDGGEEFIGQGEEGRRGGVGCIGYGGELQGSVGTKIDSTHLLQSSPPSQHLPPSRLTLPNEMRRRNCGRRWMSSGVTEEGE